MSLVPAGTEIVAALGLGDRLVAVTHDCDFPPEVRALPRVTRSAIPPHATSREIDDVVRAAASHGESTFHLDVPALVAALPDVIVGQTLCAVCAVRLDDLPSSLSPAPRVVPLDAFSLDTVFEDVRRVAQALGVAERGEALVRSLRARLDAVRERVAGRPRPRVVCLEWLDPLFNGGHWVPEQVAIAGGEDVLGEPGARSREVSWDEVRLLRPELLVVMPCGFGASRALAEARVLASLPGWDALPAARDGGVYAVDGSSYFSRPGPRLVDGVELLAALFHPDRFASPSPDAAAALRVGVS